MSPEVLDQVGGEVDKLHDLVRELAKRLGRARGWLRAPVSELAHLALPLRS